MKLKTAPALDGARWMLEGLRTFQRFPIGFASLIGVQMLLMGMALMLPVVGPLLILVSLPGLSAGWAACSQAALNGQRPTPQCLISAFTGPAKRQILLIGLAYAAAGWLMLTAIDLADPEFQTQWRAAMSTTSDEARGEALLAAQQGMLLRAALMLPIALAFWHAPFIAHQGGATAPKALFASVLTSLRNLGAFGVYGACWVAADLTLSLVLGGILGLLGAGQWAIAFAMPASLLFCAAFYASLNATHQGCLTFD